MTPDFRRGEAGVEMGNPNRFKEMVAAGGFIEDMILTLIYIIYEHIPKKE